DLPWLRRQRARAARRGAAPVPLAVSLSRTTGCGVLAVRAGDWVGVDVEAYRPLGSDALAETVLTAAERRQLGAVAPGAAREEVFHRAWTRKEAVVKAVGLGLLGMPLNALDVAPGDGGPAHRGARARGAYDAVARRGHLAPRPLVRLARPPGGRRTRRGTRARPRLDPPPTRSASRPPSGADRPGDPPAPPAGGSPFRPFCRRARPKNALVPSDE
ncbi:4'-phosphopantetheinyl transferase family protein, partial [Streptomyces sp. SolWspMP-sol7th]|uniref:4'-phosphopantetheinyl transferase family protein n=1 Tax=Streptomyces sp. SolWspMP-sol7th TaxID=1839776 RepID=UPI0020C751A1